MRIVKTLLLVAALAALTLSPAVAAPLRVATEGAYPPFSDVNEDGELIGFDVDIALALCAAMERECELVAIAWDDIIPGLEQGDYDLIVASMAKTPAREKRMDFTDYYYRSSSAFVGRGGAAEGSRPEQLDGLTVAVQEGTVQAEYLRENYPDVVLLLFESQPETYAAVADGRADLVLMDNFTALEFFNSPEGEGFDFVGDPLPADHSSGTAYIQVRKGDDRLRKEVNEALRQIRLDGTYERINARYFPFSIY